MDGLVEEMDKNLKQCQGIVYNYSQPIIDNVAEAVAGMNTSNAIKIYGDDLNTLDKIANEVIASVQDVLGIKDIGILRNIGQPEISVLLDEEKMAIYGVIKGDAQAVIEMTIDGKTATTKYEGERKFDVRIRYMKDYRKDEKDIANLMVQRIR